MDTQRCDILDQGEKTLCLPGINLVACSADCPYGHKTEIEIVYEGDDTMYICGSHGLVEKAETTGDEVQ